MDYNRYIGYLDNYCKGLKMNAAGVVRMDCLGERCSLWVSATPTEREGDTVPVYLVSDEKRLLLGEFSMTKDKLLFHVDGTKQDWDAYYGIEIPTAENWEIRGYYKEAPQEEEKEEDTVEIVEEPEEIIEMEPEEQKEKPDEPEPDSNTKWEKLFLQYPKRIPFPDGKKYLELSLADLILLPEKQFALTRNPFLVYGFQQYGYLLLDRVGQDRYHSYRLGVPGIYHPKEIQAAMQYGFDSFESEKSSPKEGEHGFYFTAVSL